MAIAVDCKSIIQPFKSVSRLQYALLAQLESEHTVSTRRVGSSSLSKGTSTYYYGVDIMKFWSEITEKLYDTPEEVIEAEDKAKADAAAAEQYQIDKTMAEKDIEETIGVLKAKIREFNSKFGTYSYCKRNPIELKDFNFYFNPFELF